MRIPAHLWNRKVVAPLAEVIALPGVNILITVISTGRVISLTGSALWPHPWLTTPAWNGDKRRWDVTVKPGFVNGLDPIVPLAIGEVDLIKRPIIPINSTRIVGEDGDPIPPFFSYLGARPPLEDAITENAIGGLVLDTTRRSNDQPPRALAAVDLYLAKARATYQSTASLVDASGTSGQQIDYSVAYDTSNLDQKGTRARLMQSSKFPSIKPSTFMERLFGTYADEGEDRQLVSTVYFLSPEQPVTSIPDQSWTPYVVHELFWNVDHAARNIPPANKSQKITLYTGLAGGFGDAAINQILSQINDSTQRLESALSVTSNEGRFWSI